MNGRPKYVVITPVSDEADKIDRTIESDLRQTVTPLEWIIVNDGTTDSTEGILDAYSKSVPWIRAVHRNNRGFRQAGGGVVAAFEDSCNLLRCKDWEYIAKLDGDLSFDREYFEKCYRQFDSNPRLGVGGGTIQSVCPDRMMIEKNRDSDMRGATTIYRRHCSRHRGGIPCMKLK